VHTTPEYRSVYYQQECSNKQSKYSLASRIKIQFSVYPEILSSATARFVLDVGLSKHPAGNHVLRYVLGSMEGEGPSSISLPYALGQWNTYVVDVTADAIAKFTSGGIDSLRGEDNALFDVRIGIDARSGDLAKIFFDDYRYIADSTLTTLDFVAKQNQMADYYGTLYPEVRQIVGTEISKFRTQPHMNAYTETSMMVDYGSHSWPDTIYYAVDQVHAVGGAVSLNHMFGTGIYGNLNETEEEKARRVRNRKMALVNTRAYRADMLEVGYRWRGGIQLAAHLDTWDTLTGNEVFLTGNGVTDSHGTEPFNGWGPWQPQAQLENNFVTWLYAAQISEADFIRARLSGRAYFGDPYRFDGSVDLASGEGFPMGRIVLTDRAQHDLYVHVDSVPADVRVRLLQGEIRGGANEYLNVNVLRDEILSGTVAGGAFADTVTLDTALSSFARIEISSSSGEEWAFSNPLHFLRQVPSRGIPAPRLAGVLGPLILLGAERFTLKSASFDSSSVQLSLGGDEAQAGAGSLEIDCGTLGAPSVVRGASSSTFDAGILTLFGFSGPGSAIEVFWSLVGVPSIHEVSLGIGHPNPFRDAGMICEFALPSKTRARLEVHDVRGRRVRTLVDEERDAGVHRVSWDGKDARGLPAGNGVYFLRLQAAGRALTSKAVKTR
jgi:hypothetical protein